MFKFLTDNAMKLMEKDVKLFWRYLYPFCNTFFSLFTLFSIFNFTFYGSDERTSALVKRALFKKNQ